MTVILRKPTLGKLTPEERELLVDAILTGRQIDDEKLASDFLGLAERVQSIVKRRGIADSSDARKLMIEHLIAFAEREGHQKPRGTYRAILRRRGK